MVVKTSSDNEEGKLVANTIADIQRKNRIQNRDFAILYRTNAQSRAIEESLRRRNIAYKIFGGISFYQRKEVKDLLAYFRLVVNPHDEEALRRIINYPKRGIGLNTIDKLHRTSLEKNESMWQVLNNTEEININKGVQKKLTEFCLTINNFKINSKNTDAHTIAEEISKKTGILNELQTDKSPEGISRLENVQELLNGIKNFSETAEEENKISDFMQDVALLTDQDREEKKDFNKITLMTIHSAKGLEFPYVFVVGLEENMFPNKRSLESQEKLEE